MKRKLHLDKLHSLVNRALSAGATRLAIGRVRWDISGNCERPHYSEFYARPSVDARLRKLNNVKGRIVVTKDTQVPMTLELHTPCRNCRTCRRQRERLWTARAIDETKLAARTWFGTLTLSPESWFAAISRCRAREATQGIDFDTLPERERLALLHADCSAEVTKMLKRVRQLVPPGALRHLMVLELHKSGVLHYHLLLHETFLGHPVRHKQLANQWPLGFSKWRLVKEEREAAYVAKYLSKSLLARVRASEGYGRGSTVLIHSPGAGGPEQADVAPQPF